MMDISGCIIDTNIWDSLFQYRKIVASNFCRPELSYFITGEISDEIDAIPISKAELKNFIEVTMLQYNMKRIFSFGMDNSDVIYGKGRWAGFDTGRWRSSRATCFIEKMEAKYDFPAKPARPTRMAPNEADAHVASWSFDGMVVVTSDNKVGPFRDAALAGGKILFLNKKDFATLDIFDRIVKMRS